jgi:hypothetical protein
MRPSARERQHHTSDPEAGRALQKKLKRSDDEFDHPLKRDNWYASSSDTATAAAAAAASSASADDDDDKDTSKKRRGGRGWLSKYQDLMIKHPLAMNSAQAAVITTVSVLISQRIAGMDAADYQEATVAALVSAAWITPILLAWFKYVSKIVGWSTVGKLMLDQLCFSPVFTATIVSWRTLLLGRVRWADLPGHLVIAIPRAILSSWCFWIPARAATMVWVPPHLRLISTSVLSFVWNIFLAILLRP